MFLDSGEIDTDPTNLHGRSAEIKKKGKNEILAETRENERSICIYELVATCLCLVATCLCFSRYVFVFSCYEFVI